MGKSLSTKLLLAVLAAVVLPFLGFAFFLEDQIADRLTREIVRQSLLGLATDLAEEVDEELAERRRDIEIWAREPIAQWSLEEALDERSGKTALTWGAAQTIEHSLYADAWDGGELRSTLARSLNRYVSTKRYYDLLLLLDADGRVVAMNGVDAAGEPLEPEFVERIFASDFKGEPWFETALGGEFGLLDQHVSPLLFPDGVPGSNDDGAEGRKLPKLYDIGLAAPVPAELAPEVTTGVLFALIDWRAFQGLIDRPVIKDSFRGLVSGGVAPSPYGWIWGRDADTILAHQNPMLYGWKVSGPKIGLPQMVEDARAELFGLYRDYEFDGKRKTAAFSHAQGPEQGSFGWVVGVGIDYDDIYKASLPQRRLLLRGTLAVLGLVLLWVLVIARRTTAPILELEQHTQKVAAGDLAARVDVRREDELGQLGKAMNQMTADLETQRQQLVKAEKDAAWREMARQVAHDLKNPLTPMQLSLDLAERARREGAPGADGILDRTLVLIRRQVKNLRDISNDFYEFTGGSKSRPERVDLHELMARVFELHRAWAEDSGIQMELHGESGCVDVDAIKIERVLTNLVTNAFQAMPDGGRLVALVEVLEAAGTPAQVRLTVTDDGQGLSDEARRRLFEPHFTTKSTGSGLGLAIAARIVEEMHGEISLAPREDGTSGVRATLVLPAYESRDDTAS